MDSNHKQDVPSRSKREENNKSRSTRSSDVMRPLTTDSLPGTPSSSGPFHDTSPSLRRFTTHLSGSSSQHPQLHKKALEEESSPESDNHQDLTCPHCNKKFTKRFSVPKHVEVSSNSALSLIAFRAMMIS